MSPKLPFANRKEFRLDLLWPLSSPEELRRCAGDAFLSLDICLAITHCTGFFKRKKNCEQASGKLVFYFRREAASVRERRGSQWSGQQTHVIWALLSTDRQGVWGGAGRDGGHGKERRDQSWEPRATGKSRDSRAHSMAGSMMDISTKRSARIHSVPTVTFHLSHVHQPNMSQKLCAETGYSPLLPKSGFTRK